MTGKSPTHPFAAAPPASGASARDGLTGLPTQAMLPARLELALAHARRRNEMMLVMAFDVDEMHAVNERFGQEGGDRLLVELSQRAAASLRGSDAVTRMDEDEFVVVAARIGSYEQADAVARRLVTRLGEPFLLDGQWMSPSISLGAALYPEHGRTPEALLAKAEAALYLAKHGGKRRHAFAAGPAA